MQVFKNKATFISLFLFFLGITLGLLGSYIAQGKELQAFSFDLSDPLEIRSGGYKLINPLYECNASESYEVKEFSELEKTLNDYIGKITSTNSVSRVSVYFRDLNNGPWFGLNEKDEFAPSSLLKLPVLIAFFKKAETDPNVLNKKITYSKNLENLMDQTIKPKDKLVIGEEYIVEDLLERMIQDSDNISLFLLETSPEITGVTEEDINRVTLDLGIPTANANNPNDFMSVKEYSSLFRVLFNASYLNNKYSEKALTILSKSSFTEGMVKYIPKNVTIAHKFGERNALSGEKQLHDCGIVYYTNHPYLLCIMTKGTDFSDLEKTIQQISEKIYSEIDQRYKNRI